MKSIFLIVLGLLMTGTVNADNSCVESAYEVLDELGIDGELIKVSKNKVNSKSGAYSSLRHWYVTPVCPRGYLVVQTTPRCKVFSTYTQNGCKIKGIKSW